MSVGQGLAFVFSESWVFFRKAWWLAILAGIPFSLSEMIRWAEVAPRLEPHFAADLLTALLDTCLYLVVIRFVAGGQRLGSAMRVDAATLRRFSPYALVAIIFVAAQYYGSLVDESARTYWLVTAAAAIFSALLAPWAVASATGVDRCGPRRSIRMAAPHLGWSLPVLVFLVLLERGGYLLLGLLPPVPDVHLAGRTFADVGYDVLTLVVASFFVVASGVASIAIARRTGLMTPVEDDILRETFS